MWVAFYGPEIINSNVGTLNVKCIYEERDNKHTDEEIRLIAIECIVKEIIQTQSRCKKYKIHML